MFPLPPMATQNVVVGHETSVRTSCDSMPTECHCVAPPVGLVEVDKKAPTSLSSMATQNVEVAQEIPRRLSFPRLFSAMLARLQAAVPPLRFVAEKTLPPMSVTRHS